mmetsp:Transcript_29467/g.66721  ORF Transcript_29467/g.66721 Transcript_29467/m.66721 type:complete len:180 (-) Transcript_29467:29-568(-)
MLPILELPADIMARIMEELSSMIDRDNEKIGKFVNDIHTTKERLSELAQYRMQQLAIPLERLKSLKKQEQREYIFICVPVPSDNKAPKDSNTFGRVKICKTGSDPLKFIKQHGQDSFILDYWSVNKFNASSVNTEMIKLLTKSGFARTNYNSKCLRVASPQRVDELVNICTRFMQAYTS